MWPNHLSYCLGVQNDPIFSLLILVDEWNATVKMGFVNKIIICLIIIACVYECSATLPPHSLISAHETKLFLVALHHVTATNYGYAHT